MKSEGTTESIKSTFRKLKMTVMSNQPLNTINEQIEEEVLRCASALEDMSLENNFEHMDEISEIQEKYRNIQEALQKRNQGKYSESDFVNKLKRILSEKEEKSFSRNNEPMKRENANSSVRPSDVSIPDKSKSIDNFFKNKEKEISKKEASFKRILDSKQFQTVNNDSVTNKSISKYSRFSKSGFRKKDEEKEYQLKHIIDEHKKMVGKLQSKIKQEEQLNDFQKNLLKQQKNRYLGKIEQLQNEIEQLYRDNYRLKQIEKSKASQTFHMDTLKQHSSAQMVYQPYVIKTRNNDLNIINEKNQIKVLSQPIPPAQMHSKDNYNFDYLGSRLQKEKPISTNQFFNRSPQNYGLYHEMFPPKIVLPKEPSFEKILDSSLDQNYNNISIKNPSKNVSISSIGQGNHFDTFQMANTLSFVNDSALGESRQMVKMSNATCTRNKVAFFKNSLVLVRDANIQIAFKRSDMNKQMNKIRIIFYINNKSQRSKRANISYEFQNEYFSVQILQKLSEIGAKSQGREVAEVTLISKADLNAVTDMHVDLGDLGYDLWLPINFIAFRSTKDYRISSEVTEMTVIPDRQFASFNIVKEIVPIMYGGTDGSETWAYLYGDSKFGSHTIKLTWKSKQLMIETSEKWIDFIGFIVHFFK